MDHSGSPVTAGPPSGGRAWGRALAPVGLACVVAAWLVVLYRWLEGIPEVPESFAQFGRLLALGHVAAGVVAVVGSFWIAAVMPAWPARRGSQAAACVIAAFVCWWLPVPFGLSRLVSFLLYALAAALAIAVALAAASRRPDRHARPRDACVAVLTAGAAASALLLSIRLNSIGWTFAID